MAFMSMFIATMFIFIVAFIIYIIVGGICGIVAGIVIKFTNKRSIYGSKTISNVATAVMIWGGFLIVLGVAIVALIISALAGS